MANPFYIHPGADMSKGLQGLTETVSRLGQQEKKEKRRAIGPIEKQKLHEYFSQILEEINYPNHKKENTKLLFKRLMGRSIPSTWEYHTLMGVFSKTLENLKHTKKH